MPETQIVVTGNVCSEPELKFVPSGAAVVSFTVASQSRKFDKQADKWVDGETTFLRCNAWRGLAENVAESLTKGTGVIVVGKLRQRNYETKEGEKRQAFEVEAEDIGPSLRFAQAKVSKAGKSAPAQDAWGSSPDNGAPF